MSKFFITRRIWTRYFSIIYNVDFRFISPTLPDAIDTLKYYVYSTESIVSLDNYCFVRIKLINDDTFKLFWSDTFDHEGTPLKGFSCFDYEELVEGPIFPWRDSIRSNYSTDELTD